MTSRRQFLRHGGRALGVLAATRLAPNLAAADSVASENILVLLHLAGGNDGLNTVVPLADADYRRLRPTLALPPAQLLPLTATHALHPACAPLHHLFHDGQLAILADVGHAAAARSHFRATEIWDTAALAENPAPAAPGWIGRYLDLSGALAAHAGPAAPRSFRGVGETRSPSLPLPSAFPASLRAIAARIAADDPARLYHTTLPGFDTHRDQLASHHAVLARLSAGLAEFQRDLRARGLADRVLTIAYSEFGRHPAENSTRGTDHGAAGPVFVLGPAVAPGLHCAPPAPGSVAATPTDFRRVYATALGRWLGFSPELVLGTRFASLPFV